MCTERRRYADAFAISARRYAEAAARIGGADVSQHDYIQQLEELPEALRNSEAAFLALRNHINEHRCGVGSANGREGHRIRTASAGRD
jgi:hypothetical protein